MNKCPTCGSPRLKRSHSRDVKEKFMKYLNQRAYRCINCGWRGVIEAKSAKKMYKGKYTLTQLFFIALVILVALLVVFYTLLQEENKAPESVGNNKYYEKIIQIT